MVVCDGTAMREIPYLKVCVRLDKGQIYQGTDINKTQGFPISVKSILH